MDERDAIIQDAFDATYGKLVFTDAKAVLQRIGQETLDYHQSKHHVAGCIASCAAAAAVIFSLTLGALAHVGPHAYPGHANPLVLASELPFAYVQHHARLHGLTETDTLRKEVLQ